MFNTDIDYGKLVEGIQVTWLGLSYKMLLAIMLFLPSFRLTGKDAPLPARSPHPSAPRDHPCRRHDLVVPRLLPTLTRHFPLRHTDGRDRLTQMPRSTWFGAQPVGEGCGGWPVAEGCGPQRVHSTLLMSGSRSSYTFLVESKPFHHHQVPVNF